MLPSRQSLKTGVGFVLIAVSMLAAGPLQLWKAENRAKLGALLGVAGPVPMVSPPQYSPPSHSTTVQSPSFTPGTPAAASPRPPEQQAAHSPLAPPAPLGPKPLTAMPQPVGVLLDYSFKNTPVAVVRVVRFPWEVVLTNPHQFHVHLIAEPEGTTPAVAVYVLDVQAQGPYVAVWIPDPGVLMAPEEVQRAYRFQLAILPGAVTRAEDGRSVQGTTHTFLVSEQSVSDNLPFLDTMTPGHLRVNGKKAQNPSGPEATRASLLTGAGLDPEAPPTPLARILARMEGSPKIPPGFFEDDAPQGR